MQTPFLSIVIPVYNAEHTISRAIKSITSQNIKNFEIIIVNDGSTDQSFEICNKISLDDQRIKLYNIENSGVSCARNLGIEQAKGKYITFLDADDYYSVNFFNVITSEIEKDTQLLIFGYNIVRDGVFKASRIPLNESANFSNEYEFRNTAVSLIGNEMINAPWNKVYLTSYIKNNKIKFPTEIDIGEDLSFNLLVVKSISFVKVCNQALVNYTVKKGEGLVSRFRPNRLEIRISLLNQIKETLDYWGVLSENQSMLDRLFVRDFMASFIDLYKKTCKLSNKEKILFIKNVLIKEDKKLKKCSASDPMTYILKAIMRTKNSVIILLFARILSLKRGFR
ncbi:glycosyltransferase family A protein [Bacillus sp. EAC]|uniref:glycosyltransferase family 2 protein n=1 Tax=Bacillus sp. EAC TaxID=1978338 RepID=UPI000B42E0DA|nr:glycosyltransferase family A protein [Bacillus sp. EAC]